MSTLPSPSGLGGRALAATTQPPSTVRFEASVEQRCARIRGRMVWILSQLEGDGTALTDMATDAKSLAALGSPRGSGEQAQLLRRRGREHRRGTREQAPRDPATHSAGL